MSRKLHYLKRGFLYAIGAVLGFVLAFFFQGGSNGKVGITIPGADADVIPTPTPNPDPNPDPDPTPVDAGLGGGAGAGDILGGGVDTGGLSPDPGPAPGPAGP